MRTDIRLLLISRAMVTQLRASRSPIVDEIRHFLRGWIIDRRES
ncbi:MAG TPA: hypothetical protein VNK23_14840 [Candidatus Dormibacteraeota bacterium]|nr:hypothetical protein [Candidatus Dormibacteraeota bacterium]